ncbi:MAG: sulfatase [Fuerstiella sp.]
MYCHRFRRFLRSVLTCLLTSVPLQSGLVLAGSPDSAAEASAGQNRPNIVWIIVDDMSANFSCYGETAIETPHVDQLAADGIRFTNAYVTAPVCSTCRSAFITGMYQTTIGAHHHRSGRGTEKIHLPEGIVPIPKMFQQAGYHTSIGGWPETRKGRFGKTDYNFEWDQSIYDGNDWSDRQPGQPFFHQIQTPGGKRRGGSPDSASRFRRHCEQVFGGATPLSKVTLPPYYPSDPMLVEDWAAYLDCCRYTDRLVGEVVDRLDQEGLLDSTVILFMTDHGISHARGKQFLYDEGLHVPLVIRGPGIAAGQARSDLVEHIDIAALSLGLAGIEIPPSMQARDILAPDYLPREAVFSARDRCDETVDHIRSVRTARFKYIRNFLPDRPLLQPCAYKDKKSILVALRAARDAGTLSDLQQRLLFSSTRAPEELYDLQADPHEMNNLAQDPARAEVLKEMRLRLADWMERSGDQGREPEPAAMFDSDMKVYVDGLKARNQDPMHVQRILDNIALMKKWAAAGK